MRTSTTDPAARTGASRVSDWWAAAAVACFVMLAVVVPLTGVVATALTKAVGLPPVPSNWTTDNFGYALSVRNAEALGRTALPGPGGRRRADLLGGCVAALERTRIGRGTASLVILTFVLPGRRWRSRC